MSIDIREDEGAMESYTVCLKMLFVDLEKLKDKRVNAILKHYSFKWSDKGRVDLTLPKFFKDAE